MTDLQDANYISGNRTEGEGKQFLEDVLARLKEVPGGAAQSELTIDTGVITPTGALHTVDTESDDPADTLTNIALDNLSAGGFLYLWAENSGRAVTVQHLNGATDGEVVLAGAANVELSVDTPLILKRVGVQWVEIKLGGAVETVNGRAGTVIIAYPGIENGKIVESNNGTAATYALKTLAGNDPSAIDPVRITFPNGVTRVATAALSLTIPSTATLGFANGSAGRLWFSIVDDDGTLRIGVRNCSNANSIAGFPCTGVLSSTTIGTGADSAKVTYTDSGVTSKPFIIAAFATYESGLTTAGTWDAAPSSITQFGPGITRPGEATGNMAAVVNGAGSTTTATSETDVTGATVNITPASAVNKVRFSMTAVATVLAAGAGANSMYVGDFRRGSTTIASVSIGVVSGSGTNFQTRGAVAYAGLDSPESASAVTYKARHYSSTTGSESASTESVNILVEEIMG